MSRLAHWVNQTTWIKPHICYEPDLNCHTSTACLVRQSACVAVDVTHVQLNVTKI